VSGESVKVTKNSYGLERGLTNYGDRDFSLYLRRSFAQSMGYSRALLGKPVVGSPIRRRVSITATAIFPSSWRR